MANERIRAPATEEWAKDDKESSVDKETVFMYLESTTTKKKCLVKILLIFLFLLIGFSCTSGFNTKRNEDVQKTIPPPPVSAREQRVCDSLKAIAYHDISIGEITICFNDSIRNNKAAYERFVAVLKDSLGFNYFRMYGVNNFETLPYKYCVQPIMDSVIATKYGKNAKDSIINEAYRLTEIAYKKEDEK